MSKRGWIVAICAALVILFLWFIAPKGSEEEPQQDKTWDMDSGSAAVPATPTVPPQLTMTIQSFVEGYYSWSFQDEKADAWIGRTAEWCTDRYAKKLITTYGQGDGGSAWAEIKTDRQVSSAQNLDISQLSLSRDKAEYLVSFDHVTESIDGDGYRPVNKVIELVNTRRGWFVSNWFDLSDGPKFVDEVAPTDSPDDQYFIG
ncbi:hypothetical protein ACTXPA_17775 [Glutamicibacter arilaitensis]|uniref:hypothetical protein n=1 Tax=Glutamicibacter arilaitensis TaxID=256701 RepID=UPI003FCF5D93